MSIIQIIMVVSMTRKQGEKIKFSSDIMTV